MLLDFRTLDIVPVAPITLLELMFSNKITGTVVPFDRKELFCEISKLKYHQIP